MLGFLIKLCVEFPVSSVNYQPRSIDLFVYFATYMLMSTIVFLHVCGFFQIFRILWFVFSAYLKIYAIFVCHVILGCEV